MSKAQTVNWQSGLSAQDSISGQQVYVTSTNHKLDVNASVSISGSPLPISGASTALVTAIVDGSGNQITSFGGGTQYTDGGIPPTHPIGNTIEWSDGSNWQTVSTAKPLPVSASFSPSGTQDVNLIKVGGTNISIGQQLAAASLPVILPSATITTLTPPSNTGYALDSSLTTIDTDLKSNITLHAGTNLIGKVGIDQTTPGTTNKVYIGTDGVVGIAAGSAVIGHVITDTGSTTAVTGTVTISGTVTANAGTNLNTSLLALESGGNLASIKSDVDNLNLAQASTTSGQKGNLILAAVTTAAPTYTTAQSNPLSLTITGLLRVDGSGVTQPVSLTSTTITGTVAVTQSGTWTNTVTQATGTNLHIVIDSGTVGTTSAAINVGQQTVNTTVVQISASSTVPTNGILIGALSTNSASIFVGGSGVTTSTGVELQPGSSIPFTANLNTLYIISVASTTDKIWYNVT